MLDLLNLFQPNTTGQAITATAASSSVIPLSVFRDIGRGNPVKLECLVLEAFTDGSSDSTVTVTLEQDDDEAFGTVTTAQTIGVFGALSAVGTKLEALIQPGAVTKKFIRLKYTVANGNLTTGKIFSAIVDSHNQGNNYPVGSPAIVNA